MTALWSTIIVAAVGCYALKLAGVSLPDSVMGRPGVQRTAALLPVAMLSALVITDLFDSGGHYAANWHALAGVGAGVVALSRRCSLPVVLLVAVAVTAALRSIGASA
jgi:branched-subunit amino acid transport protein